MNPLYIQSINHLSKVKQEEFQEVSENGKGYVPFSSHPPDWHTGNLESVCSWVLPRRGYNSHSFHQDRHTDNLIRYEASRFGERFYPLLRASGQTFTAIPQAYPHIPA